MTEFELLHAADVRLMQAMAQRVTASHPELVNSDASYGELAWNWGRGHAAEGGSWPRRLWSAGDELIAWGWAQLPRRVRRIDGTIREVTGAYLAYQVHPEHAGLVDEVIDWYDAVAPGLERTVLPGAADEFGLARWTAHGYVPDPAGNADDGFWTMLNERDLTDVDEPVLPDGFRFRTADEAGPDAAVRAHQAAWAGTSYNAAGYRGVRETGSYRGELHVLVEAPDGTMAGSVIGWLDEVNKSVEFEPVGTHPGYRRLGLGRAMLLHAMRQARDAGAGRATVACAGAPAFPKAIGLYHGLGFREISRDLPMIKPATAG
jgi:ribosomal protein S18 acetylase RimI-like enzyme